MGFSMATSTLVGQSIGAGNIARAEKVARLAAILTFSVLTGVGLLCMVLAPAIVRFFVPGDPAVIREGAAYIRIVAWSFGFIGLQFALLGVLRASGEMIPAMMIGLVSQWLLQIPLAFALSRYEGLGIDGVWWSTPISNVITAIIAALWFARGSWKTRRLIPPTLKQQEAVEEQAQM
jgi:Na+-driven multidrug efflux pump